MIIQKLYLTAGIDLLDWQQLQDLVNSFKDRNIDQVEQYSIVLSLFQLNQIQRANVLDFVISSDPSDFIKQYLHDNRLLTHDQEVILKYPREEFNLISIDFETWCRTPIKNVRVLRAPLQKYLSPAITLYPNLSQSIAEWFKNFANIFDQGDKATAEKMIRFKEYECDEYTDLFMAKDAVEPYESDALFQFFVLSCQYKAAFVDMVYPYIKLFREQLKTKDESSAKLFIVQNFDRACDYLRDMGFQGFDEQIQ